MCDSHLYLLTQNIDSVEFISQIFSNRFALHNNQDAIHYTKVVKKAYFGIGKNKQAWDRKRQKFEQFLWVHWVEIIKTLIRSYDKWKKKYQTKNKLTETKHKTKAEKERERGDLQTEE